MCKSGLPPYQHWSKQKGKGANSLENGELLMQEQDAKSLEQEAGGITAFNDGYDQDCNTLEVDLCPLDDEEGEYLDEELEKLRSKDPLMKKNRKIRRKRSSRSETAPTKIPWIRPSQPQSDSLKPEKRPRKRAQQRRRTDSLRSASKKSEPQSQEEA